MGYLTLNQLEDNAPFEINESQITRVGVSNSNTFVEYIREETGYESMVFVSQTQAAILNASECLIQISEIFLQEVQNYLINVTRVLRVYQNIDNPLLGNIEYESGGAIRSQIFTNENFLSLQTAIKTRKQGGTPDALTSVTNQVVLVDKTNGDDSTAQKYNLARPYRTIVAANTAASSGDTIVVLPATTDYNTYDSDTNTYPRLGKDGVNWS